MFRKMPFILTAIIIAVIFWGKFLPVKMQEILYALSLSIKSVIIFLLPVIIFGLLFKAAVHLSHNAGKIIFLILAGVCCSNFIAAFLSHYLGVWIYHFNLSVLSAYAPHHVPMTAKIPETPLKELMPAWPFTLPVLIANNKALMGGIVLGIITARFKPALARKTAGFFDKIIGKILFGFTYMIPLFAAGFVVKLAYDGVINAMIKNYAFIFIIIAAAQTVYIAGLYLIANSFKLSGFIHSIKNMFPAAVTGFCTMSSAATMPLTIIGVQKNMAHQKALANSLITATVNIHLIGDCFAIPIFAYAVLKTYGMPAPMPGDYLVFTVYFVLAKFSVAAIPGGGIIVMLPVLQQYLGFNSPMLSLITAVYILFDPAITCANVLGNGAFALIAGKLTAFNKK